MLARVRAAGYPDVTTNDMLRELERLGYVERHADPKDGRACHQTDETGPCARRSRVGGRARGRTVVAQPLHRETVGYVVLEMWMRELEQSGKR